MDADLLPLIPLFFLVALFYSSAGFGGGSSYLAILALFPIEYSSIRHIALICNITVVAGSVFLFYRNDLIPYKKVWPLILFSIPLAYLGGTFILSKKVFFVFLGMTLLLAGMAMLYEKKGEIRRLPQYSNGFIGGGIGFLSGLVGIGGGIFLSPVLYLSKWHFPKSIAATTALYILVNSLAGLAGQLSSDDLNVDVNIIVSLVVAVFIGGQIGSRLTIFKINPIWVKRISAVLIFLVGVRLLVQNMI